MTGYVAHPIMQVRACQIDSALFFRLDRMLSAASAADRIQYRAYVFGQLPNFIIGSAVVPLAIRPASSRPIANKSGKHRHDLNVVRIRFVLGQVLQGVNPAKPHRQIFAAKHLDPFLVTLVQQLTLRRTRLLVQLVAAPYRYRQPDGRDCQQNIPMEAKSGKRRCRPAVRKRHLKITRSPMRSPDNAQDGRQRQCRDGRTGKQPPERLRGPRYRFRNVHVANLRAVGSQHQGWIRDSIAQCGIGPNGSGPHGLTQPAD